MSSTPTPADSRRQEDLVAAIVASTWAEPVTRHVDAPALPSRDGVVRATNVLRELLFPGYFGKQDLDSAGFVYHTTALLAAVRRELFDQVRAALRHHAGTSGAAGPIGSDDAAGVVDHFLATIPGIRAVLATDVLAAFDGDPAAASTDEIIFSYPGVFAIAVYRLAHELHRLGVPLVPRMMTEYAHSRTGIDIHPGARVGGRFFIDHGTGVVIGETTVIGTGVRLYQGVTLGALSTRGGQRLRGAKRHPTIEDDVTIYSGASILGGDTVIGEGAVIASNAFITRSVPPHTRVTARPPDLDYQERRQRGAAARTRAPDWSI